MIGRDREFVIDAASAVEFAAKAVIAEHDVAKLYKTKGQPLPEAELFMLDPCLMPDHDLPTGALQESALKALLDRRTISLGEAVDLASELVDVDTAAADQLREARNAAIHIGSVIEGRIDDLACDFLTVCGQLWDGLERSVDELWGDLRAIADPEHMKAQRTAAADAEVRVITSRRRWRSLGVNATRRANLTSGALAVPCPSCNHRALLSTQPVGSAPGGLLSKSDSQRPVEVLDCLLCGLTLFGSEQIRWADGRP